MPGGGSRFINIIAIEQMHAGHAKMAGLVAAGCGSSTYLGRIIIIVDDISLYPQRTYDEGMEIITSTQHISDIVHRNVPGSDASFIGFTRRDWRRK